MPPRKKTDAAAKPKKAPAKPRTSKKKPPAVEPGSAGIEAAEALTGTPSAAFPAACDRVVAAGGVVAGKYREPLGGFWVALAVLPIHAVEPTPYQRELSPAHADRLAMVI